MDIAFPCGVRGCAVDAVLRGCVRAVHGLRLVVNAGGIGLRTRASFARGDRVVECEIEAGSRDAQGAYATSGGDMMGPLRYVNIGCSRCANVRLTRSRASWHAIALAHIPAGDLVLANYRDPISQRPVICARVGCHARAMGPR